MSEKGELLPKFGDWDVNDPTSAERFTETFNKARDIKKTGGKPESPDNSYSTPKRGVNADRPLAQAKKWFCCT